MQRILSETHGRQVRIPETGPVQFLLEISRIRNRVGAILGSPAAITSSIKRTS